MAKSVSKVRAKKTRHLSSRDVARLITQAAYNTKADELTILDLRKISDFTDFFVIASGRSDRQVQAISDRIGEALDEKKISPIGIEGYPKGHWILMDYGAVVAHIFYEGVRPFYALEKLWGDASPVRFRLK